MNNKTFLPIAVFLPPVGQRNADPRGDTWVKLQGVISRKPQVLGCRIGKHGPKQNDRKEGRARRFIGTA